MLRRLMILVLMLVKKARVVSHHVGALNMRLAQTSCSCCLVDAALFNALPGNRSFASKLLLLLDRADFMRVLCTTFMRFGPNEL